MESDFILFIIVCAFITLIYILIHVSCKNTVKEKVKSLDAVFISCRREYGFFNVGPYKWVNKYQHVYSFEYRLDNEIIEGWVRFSLLREDEWVI